MPWRRMCRNPKNMDLVDPPSSIILLRRISMEQEDPKQMKLWFVELLRIFCGYKSVWSRSEWECKSSLLMNLCKIYSVIVPLTHDRCIQQFCADCLSDPDFMPLVPE